VVLTEEGKAGWGKGGLARKQIEEKKKGNGGGG
jgi:hypothetical protein